MPRARIGKLFHLTPLVDDLAPAEYFFNSLFAPLCMMRNYAELWHRHAAIYVIDETSIEPMHCLAREPGSDQEETSWYRYAERFGPRVHNMAFYVHDIDDLAERLQAAGRAHHRRQLRHHRVLPPEGHAGHARVPPCHRRHLGDVDPRFQPGWKAFAESYWPHHPLGTVRMSHITVVTGDLAAADELYVGVLDAQPLPEQPSTIAGRHVAALPRRRGHRRRDDGSAATPTPSPPATSTGSVRR